MRLPLQVTFRDIPPSQAVLQHVRRRATKLDTFFGRLMSCRVAVGAPHRHHHHGKRYQVRVDMTVPNGELVVAHLPNNALVREDLHAAIDITFDQAERVLSEYARRLRMKQRRPERFAPPQIVAPMPKSVLARRVAK